MKKRHFEQQPQEPWGQSHRPVPPPDVGRKRHRRKHSGFALLHGCRICHIGDARISFSDCPDSGDGKWGDLIETFFQRAREDPRISIMSLALYCIFALRLSCGLTMAPGWIKKCSECLCHPLQAYGRICKTGDLSCNG